MQHHRYQISLTLAALGLALPAFGAAPAAPTITGYAATNPRGVPIFSAPPGAPLLILGSNLGTSGTVAFNGIPAPPPASWSSTEILVTVPTASSYPFQGPVTVTTNGQTATGPPFTITPPPPAPPMPRPGDLDPGFGTGGRVLTDFGGGADAWAYAVAMQPDGQIVAAGEADAADGTARLALARYRGNGTLDTSFGTGGKVVTDFGEAGWANAVAVQPDGRIVVAGFSAAHGTADFGLARYTANGALDPSFGTGGKVLTDFGGDDDVAFALAVQPDGQIVAAGRSDANGKAQFALARYNRDGSLDSSFGAGGRVLTDFGGNAGAFALALQPDGQIVVAGAADFLGPELNSLEHAFALARYTGTGALDPSFGSGGQVRTGLVGGAWAYGVGVQPDGRILAAGAGVDGSPGFWTALYTGNGALAPLPALDKVLTVFGDRAAAGAYAVAAQPDGPIVVGGFSNASGTNDFALARYNGNGALDASFGSGGEVLTDFGDNEGAIALALQPNGQIVAAGFSSINGNYEFALSRYQGR